MDPEKGRCERCRKPMDLHLYDYCVRCSKDLCPDCMRDGLCRVPCVGYVCPDAQYARDVECLCANMACPSGPDGFCSTFTIDRRTECPCE